MKNKKEEINEYARKVLALASGTIRIRFRYFARALSSFSLQQEEESGVYRADGKTLYYDPARLLRDYIKEPGYPVHLLLHILLHHLFLHPFRSDRHAKREEEWNLACDIAVEALILELDYHEGYLSRDDEAKDQLVKLRKWIPNLSADKIYSAFVAEGIDADSKMTYKRLFSMDLHPAFQKEKQDEIMILEEDWKKLSERMKTELRAFSEESKESELLLEKITYETRKKVDYGALLRRFSVISEEMLISPDEYDYIYYTYGLATYGNMPLIEPLEYVEDKRIREFVIAIDTSASCKGELVRGFLEKTFAILSQSGTFSDRRRIHIMECDHTIRSDEVIQNDAQLREYLDAHVTKGYGATDYRPVFARVDSLLKEKKLDDLKGLIYLTDGYGIYPQKGPGYEVIFAYLKEDNARPKAPSWAMSVTLED